MEIKHIAESSSSPPLTRERGFRGEVDKQRGGFMR